MAKDVAETKIDFEMISEAAQAKVADTVKKRNLQKSPVVQQKIIVENKTGNMALMKYTGSTPGSSEANSIKYFSKRKGLSFYLTENDLIAFNNYVFYTDDEDIIEYLDNNKLLGVEYWKNEFPPHIIKKREQDKMMLTFDKEQYQ